MLSRRWSITWRLFRLLGKLLIYKTIKSQCWDIVALLLHEFLEGDCHRLSCRKQKASSVSSVLPLFLLICLYLVLNKGIFFSLMPWVVCLLLSSTSFLTLLGKKPELQCHVGQLSDGVDPICMFHRGTWTPSSREKKNICLLPTGSRSLWTRRQILHVFLHLPGRRNQSQMVFPSTVCECRSALTLSADTVALFVLSKTLHSHRLHSLSPKEGERRHITLFNRAWTTNYITKHSTKLIIQGTSRMWYKWCKCVNSE